MSDQKRVVELAVDKLLREAAKKLGITEQCFYNVFHHAEDVIKVDDSYMYAMELHYNVYVPTGASEKFKKLINPILLTGGMEVVEMEPGEAYDEKMVRVKLFWVSFFIGIILMDQMQSMLRRMQPKRKHFAIV